MKGILEKLVVPDKSPLDEKLLDIILLVAPILGLIFAVLTYIFNMPPWHLPWVIVILSIIAFILRISKSLIPLMVKKTLFISTLYTFNIYLTYSEEGNINDFYVFLVPLIASLLLFRKNYILITLVNLIVVLTLAYVEYDSGFFNSMPDDGTYMSLKLNYLLLALVLMICVYVLTENMFVERNRLSLKSEELEEKNNKLDFKNQELKKITGVQRRMLAIISHDIKNPIDSLTGMVDLLQRNILSPQELKMISRQLHKQLNTTSLNLSNLLNWARSQSEKVTIRKESINLDHSIKETLSFLNDGISSKNLDLATSIPDDLLACGDVYVLQVVLRNLISNAIKFTPKGGSINISAHTENEMIQIDVADSGVGIEEKVKDKLFAQSITTRGTNGEKGNGFGLSLVKEYTEANGGSIWVESEINKGSVFSFTMPVCKCQRENNKSCKSESQLTPS